jgi:hypothetical protein
MAPVPDAANTAAMIATPTATSAPDPEAVSVASANCGTASGLLNRGERSWKKLT